MMRETGVNACSDWFRRSQEPAGLYKRDSSDFFSYFSYMRVSTRRVRGNKIKPGINACSDWFRCSQELYRFGGASGRSKRGMSRFRGCLYSASQW